MFCTCHDTGVSPSGDFFYKTKNIYILLINQWVSIICPTEINTGSKINTLLTSNLQVIVKVIKV